MNLDAVRELVAFFEKQGIPDTAVTFESMPGGRFPRAVAAISLDHPFWRTVTTERGRPGKWWQGCVEGISVVVEAKP